MVDRKVELVYGLVRGMLLVQLLEIQRNLGQNVLVGQLRRRKVSCCWLVIGAIGSRRDRDQRGLGRSGVAVFGSSRA